MRLSTAPDRDDERSVAVLHAAFDAGLTFLDTADAYCWDSTETGHNERLIAHALATWRGDQLRIRVATKGGLTRPHGDWVADGRARHLVGACEASRRALGVERLQLYQLHAVDPRTPLATSMRALASLQRAGHIDAIGLCNVTVGQIEEARRFADIASVQVELSIWNTKSILSGVVQHCLANGIQLLAYRPLGGPDRRRQTLSDSLLADLAKRHRVSAMDIALAWLLDLSDLIVPLPGPTRVETVSSIARAQTIVFSDEDRARLDERFPSGRTLRDPGREQTRDFPGPTARERVIEGSPATTGAEIVLIMGMPAAGKSTLAETFVTQGYVRLNRDQQGGSLAKLLPPLDHLIASGASRVVLDNTYPSRASRAPVVQAAKKHGIHVRCIWMSTSLEDAQVNAVSRMVARYGRLLPPEEIRKLARRDPATFVPSAQFRYRREFEPPDAAEGFAQIDVVPFERVRDPAFSHRALLLWCDGILFRSRAGNRGPLSADDVAVFAERAEILRRYQAEGWRLLGLSWRPDIVEHNVSVSEVDATFARMRELLAVSIEVEYCPHPAGPPICWCRKPLPGLGVVFIQRLRLDPTQCVYVGTGPQDPGFARRLGFQFREAAEVFG